jgi:hypothetical protein
MTAPNDRLTPTSLSQINTAKGASMRGEFDFQDWSIPAVWLLRGVVYADEERTWNLLLSNVSRLEEYFFRIGLRLVVDESEGMAYLRQLEEDELPDGAEALPKLFRNSRLSYGQTVLCVLLRNEFRGFEEEDVHNERCVVEELALFDQWKVFFPVRDDDVKQHREMVTSLRKLEELGFVRRFSDDPVCWEVRRILKARLPATELENLKNQLTEAIKRRNSSGNA